MPNPHEITELQVEIAELEAERDHYREALEDILRAAVHPDYEAAHDIAREALKPTH